MRRIWVGFGLVLVAAVGTGLSTTRTIGQPAPQPAVGGDRDPNHRKVTVTGVGTVAVKPDVARVSFAVKATGADFKTAVAECDKRGAAIEKAVADLKLGGLEIKKGPILLTSMNAPNFFHAAPPLAVPPGPPGVPGRPGGIAASAVNAPEIGFVSAQVNPSPRVDPPPQVNPMPLNLQPQQAPAPPAIQPGIQPVAPPIPQPAPGGPQPLIGPGQPFPGPAGPWGMHGSGIEVSRSYTIVASFGVPGAAGELADVVKVTDRIQGAVVGAGGTESPLFLSPASPFGGINAGNTSKGPGVVKIEFHRANPATLRQEALKLAVADAVANARAAAGVANLTTRDIVTLSDQNPMTGNPFGLAGGAAPTGRGEVLGEMEITVQVSVTFNY